MNSYLQSSVAAWRAPISAWWVLAALWVLSVLLALLPAPVPVPSLKLLGPSLIHWLGTDELGRAVGYMTCIGTARSLRDGFAIAIVSGLLGLVAGAVSALRFNGLVDRALALVGDTLRSFPTVLLALLFSTVGLPIVIILIVLLWVPVWRVSRSTLAFLLAEPYALRARLAGQPMFLILLRETLPNAWPAILPTVLIVAADSFVALVALEFLGFGVELGKPSLGVLLARVLTVGLSAPWIWIPATLLTMSLVGLFAFIADITEKNRPGGTTQCK